MILELVALGTVWVVLAVAAFLLMQRLDYATKGPEHSQWCGGEIREIDVSVASSYLGIDHTLPWLLKRSYFRCGRCGSIAELDRESGKVMLVHWRRA